MKQSFHQLPAPCNVGLGRPRTKSFHYLHYHPYTLTLSAQYLTNYSMKVCKKWNTGPGMSHQEHPGGGEGRKYERSPRGSGTLVILALPEEMKVYVS